MKGNALNNNNKKKTKAHVFLTRSIVEGETNVDHRIEKELDKFAFKSINTNEEEKNSLLKKKKKKCSSTVVISRRI